MTDHELQSWLKNIADTEAQFWNYIDYLDNTEPLDDTFGWGARLRRMWEKDPNRPCGLLLTGPDGCGKHTAATHMFRILSDDYYIVLMNGTTLCEGGYADATARLLGTIKDYAKANKPMCLILDGLEKCGFRRDLFSFLGQILTVSWLRDVQMPPVFLILIDNLEEDIPAILRSRLRLCRMALPNANRRRAFLQRESFPMIQGAVNLDLLVKSTNGLTYAQLGDLARNLESALYLLPKDQFSFTDEELKEFLQEQKPSASAIDDPMKSLAMSARQFIENLPELMKHMGTAVVSTTVAKETQTNQPGSNPKTQPGSNGVTETLPSKEDIINMPVSDMCTELFGKERLDKMKANRQRA